MLYCEMAGLVYIMVHTSLRLLVGEDERPQMTKALNAVWVMESLTERF